MIRRGLDGLDAFRSLLTKNAQGLWCWDDCLGEQFDLMQNVQFLDEQPILRNIDDIVTEDLMNVELPMNEPLWRVYVYVQEGRTLCVFKFHHAISDGPGLSQVFGRMIDDAEAGEVEIKEANRRRLMSLELKKKTKRSLWEKIRSWMVTLACVVLAFLKGSLLFGVQPRYGKEWIFDGSDEKNFPLRKIVRTAPVSIEHVSISQTVILYD
jgi:hypothetical protein